MFFFEAGFREEVDERVPSEMFLGASSSERSFCLGVTVEENVRFLLGPSDWLSSSEDSLCFSDDPVEDVRFSPEGSGWRFKALYQDMNSESSSRFSEGLF